MPISDHRPLQKQKPAILCNILRYFDNNIISYRGLRLNRQTSDLMAITHLSQFMGCLSPGKSRVYSLARGFINGIDRGKPDTLTIADLLNTGKLTTMQGNLFCRGLDDRQHRTARW